MRYFFVCLSIVVIWVAAILIAATSLTHNTNLLFFTVQGLTVALFYLGFYRK